MHLAVIKLKEATRGVVLLPRRWVVARSGRLGVLQRIIRACIPARAKRSHPTTHAVRLSQQRHTIEHMFGRLTDWRRLVMRDDRCAHTVVSAMCLAATGIFWLSFTRPDPGHRPTRIIGVDRTTP